MIKNILTTLLLTTYLPWNFYVFEEPTLSSTPVANFPSMTLSIEEKGTNGWGRVSSIGNHDFWVYLNAPASPDPWADWTPPSTTELDQYFRQFGQNVSIYFKNIPSGFVYMHNPDRVFFGASVPKLYQAFYVYTLAEHGYLDLTTTHTYSLSDFWGGTGVIRHRPFGLTYTTRELLGYSVRESDNVAQRMLDRLTRNQGFSYLNFAQSLGVNTQMFQGSNLNIVSQNISARDAGRWANAIWAYLNDESAQFAPYLSSDLATTSVGFIQADYPILQKYGWYHQHMHDLAFVQSPSPYILIILTNLGHRGGLHITNQPTPTHQTFVEISEVIQTFNQQYFRQDDTGLIQPDHRHSDSHLPLLPLRDTFEYFGYTVVFDGSLGLIHFYQDDRHTFASLTSSVAIVNGQIYVMPHPIQIVGGVALAPFELMTAVTGYGWY